MPWFAHGLLKDYAKARGEERGRRLRDNQKRQVVGTNLRRGQIKVRREVDMMGS